LKEALAMAAKHAAAPAEKTEKAETKESPVKPIQQEESPSLKEALGKIVGEPKAPAQMPESTLRDMLRVDELGNEVE
jgi:hypothetical protein